MNELHAPMRISIALAIPLLAVLSAMPAAAQDRTAPPADDPFTAIGRWFSDSFSSMNARFKNAGQEVGNFNREAGIAARATGGAVKDAADAVARLPNARVVSGHQKCVVAANGAPDCTEAANRLCKARGLASGQSLDVTAAEECPIRVTLGRQDAKPGDCKTVTFVSKAMCR